MYDERAIDTLAVAKQLMEHVDAIVYARIIRSEVNESTKESSAEVEVLERLKGPRDSTRAHRTLTNILGCPPDPPFTDGERRILV